MIDDLREALEHARNERDDSKVEMRADGQERLPDDPLGLDEMRAMCAAARDRGHGVGYERGRRHGVAMGELRAVGARRDGETDGALAAIHGMLHLIAGKHPDRSDRTRYAEGRREVLAELAGELRVTASALRSEGVHGERGAAMGAPTSDAVRK